MGWPIAKTLTKGRCGKGLHSFEVTSKPWWTSWLQGLYKPFPPRCDNHIKGLRLHSFSLHWAYAIGNTRQAWHFPSERFAKCHYSLTSSKINRRQSFLEPDSPMPWVCMGLANNHKMCKTSKWTRYGTKDFRLNRNWCDANPVNRNQCGQ